MGVNSVPQRNVGPGCVVESGPRLSWGMSCLRGHTWRGNAGHGEAAGYSEVVASFPGDRLERKRLYLERFA